jgi:hypothetical protein
VLNGMMSTGKLTLFIEKKEKKREKKREKKILKNIFIRTEYLTM